MPSTRSVTPCTMKAIIQSQYGSPDVLQLADVIKLTNLTFEAAAVPTSAISDLQALRECGQFRTGQRSVD